MCGRFSMATPARVIAEAFDVVVAGELRPRYNIAPTQDVVVVRRDAGGACDLVALRWGLIPSWSKDPAIGNRMINARAETLAEKASFRSALGARRCLVLADGFYEWQRLGERKQPFHFRLREGSPFAFAGLWERWAPREGRPIESCTIVTTAANATVAPIHERMPVILSRASGTRWIEPGLLGAGELAELLAPCSAEAIVAVKVSDWVNSPSHDDPRCVAPAHPG